jgi:hypothetical protein
MTPARLGRVNASQVIFCRGRAGRRANAVVVQEQELDILVAEFQRDWATKGDHTGPMPPKPLLY